MIRNFLLILFLNLSFTSLSLAQDSTKYVTTLDDFYMHMKNHVDNVEIIADRILKEIESDPAKWKPVFNIPDNVTLDNQLKTEIRNFIENHDASKINTSAEFLKKYNRDKGIINELYTLYGKSFKDMTPADRKIIDELNHIDAKERELFIQRNKLPEWKVQLIDNIEKMADGTERGMNPVTAEEMAKIPWKESQGVENKLKTALAEGKGSDEIQKLQKKLELLQKMESRYSKETTLFTNYRERIKKIKSSLRASGVLTEYLEEFATYRLIDKYEQVFGQKINPDDPNLTKKLKTFFFQSKQGADILRSSINVSAKNEANIMIELGILENNPAKEGKWTNLFQALGGKCVN